MFAAVHIEENQYQYGHYTKHEENSQYDVNDCQVLTEVDRHVEDDDNTDEGSKKDQRLQERTKGAQRTPIVWSTCSSRTQPGA
jgi:hypothetical protein